MKDNDTNATYGQEMGKENLGLSGEVKILKKAKSSNTQNRIDKKMKDKKSAK